MRAVKLWKWVACVCLIASTGWADAPKDAPGKWMKKAEAGKPIFADLATSAGHIVVRLYSKEAPKTVSAFVGMASGEKSWRNPQGVWVHQPLYNGTIFHRTIKGFMIQGGDPTGTGTFQPGFNLEAEPGALLPFNKVGLLAMANTGSPVTSGSQFFITVSMPHWLDRNYLIFGEVVSGYEVVQAIANRPVEGDRPIDPVKLEKVTLMLHPPKGHHPRHAKKTAKAK